MANDWKEKIRSGCNLHVKRSANGGVIVEEMSLNSQHVFETLIAATDTVQFLALMAEAMEVTPEQIARERDRRQGAGTGVRNGIDQSAAEAFQRDLLRRLRVNMPADGTTVLTDAVPPADAKE